MKKVVPLFGSGTLGKSSNVTAQRRVNLYAEPFPDPDKTPKAFYSRPGLLKGFNDPNSVSAFPGGPMRGMIVTRTLTTGVEVVYAAQGSHSCLASYPGRFGTSDEGFFETSSGVVQFANNGTATVAVDGVTGYLMGTGSMEVAGVSNFPDGARSICFLAGRFIVDDPTASGKFRWSGLNDHTDWDTLNFATAEASPDALMQVFERGGEVLLFGTRTLEAWAPTGTATVFERVGGSGIDWGLAVFDSVRKANSSVLFLGRNLGGQPQVCQLDGYQIRVVSNPDVEHNINAALAAGAYITTSVVTFAGHTWYIVNLTATSYAYDLTTGLWDEWQTEGARWAGQYTSQYRNTAIVTDYRDGRVYYLDAERYTDDTAAIVREITTRHVFSDFDNLTLSDLQLDAEVGVGLSSGQGSDPQIMLQVSKDGGHTFGAELWRTLGAQGKYRTPVTWKRLGTAEDWTFRFRVADPVKVVLLNVAAEFSR